MIKLNHKAFTLVELIVVITILGIILILALPQASRIQRQNKNRKYELYQESLENAAKLYIDNNAKDLFGKEDSGCVQIKFSTLKDANLTKEFSDSDIVCGNDSDTFVEVRKTKEHYTYHSQLICRDKENPSNILYEYSDGIEGTSCLNVRDETGPEITITPESSAWKRKETLKVTITISDVSGLNKNIAISYYWTNLDTGEKSKTYHYNYKNKNNVGKVSYTIPTEDIDIESGRYRLTVESDPNSPTGIMDMMGNRRVAAKTAESYYIDNTPPTCTTTGGGDDWSEKDITLVGTCKDNESGCVENVSKKFTDLYRDSLETPGTVEDKVGNKTECPEQRVRISKTPNKPTINNPNNGKWVNYNYAVTGSTTSSNDLVSYWQTSTDNKNWTTIKGATTNSFTSETYSTEQNTIRYFRVCNEGDICSESASTQILIDKTNPYWHVTMHRGGYTYVGQGYVNFSCYAKIDYYDDLSGLEARYNLVGNAGTVMEPYGNLHGAMTTAGTDTDVMGSFAPKNYAYYGFTLCDMAGNCAHQPRVAGYC